MGGARDTKVVFIGGFGRSGSTLLDRLLGQLPDFVSLGEVKYLWERGLCENQLCGCGVPLRSCPFWTEVGERAFGGWDAIDAAAVARRLREVDRHRYIPALAVPGLSRSLGRRVEAVGPILRRLYAAIGEVSGATVLVDSSVDPSTALLLRRVPGIDLRVVHLVRDSRGVAMSLAKRVVRPEVVTETAYMYSQRPASTAMRWAVDNAVFEAIRASGVPTIRIGYESLVRAPVPTLRTIARLLDRELDDDALGFLGDGTVDLAANHTVAGNPMRLRTGVVALRVDDAWRTAMPAGSRLAVSALTWPLLRRYGYSKNRS